MLLVFTGMILVVEYCASLQCYRSLYHVDRSEEEQGDMCDSSEKFIMVDPVGFKISTQVKC